jgi:hypothetical protein
LQLVGELPEAGFPAVRHLGSYALPGGAYTGPLYEVRGQAFRRLERDFPPVRDAPRTAPSRPLAAPLADVFNRRFGGGRSGVPTDLSGSGGLGGEEPLDGTPTLVVCCMKHLAPATGPSEVWACVCHRPALSTSLHLSMCLLWRH